MHCLVVVRDLKYVIELFSLFFAIFHLDVIRQTFFFFSLLQLIEPLRIHSTKYFFSSTPKDMRTEGRSFLANIPERSRKVLFFRSSVSSFFPSILLHSSTTTMMVIIEEKTRVRERKKRRKNDLQ